MIRSRTEPVPASLTGGTSLVARRHAGYQAVTGYGRGRRHAPKIEKGTRQRRYTVKAVKRPKDVRVSRRMPQQQRHAASRVFNQLTTAPLSFPIASRAFASSFTAMAPALACECNVATYRMRSNGDRKYYLVITPTRTPFLLRPLIKFIVENGGCLHLFAPFR